MLSPSDSLVDRIRGKFRLDCVNRVPKLAKLTSGCLAITLKEMSHEGIRFVSEEEARKAQAMERELSHEAKEPAKVRVFKSEGTGMEIVWKDGHRSHWSFAWLRHACPCATCHDEREKSGRKPGEPKPKPQTLLPMYQPPPLPESVTPVGRYAISFHWNDGHQSGIYSWDYLRRHCGCEKCKEN